MLPAIVAALRQRCPSFAGRIAGAAEFAAVTDNANLTVPAAYVVPLDDKPGEAVVAGGYRQELTDSFSVVVALANTSDRRGQAAVDGVRQLRAELWRALLGWEPDGEHGEVTYEGGQVLEMNRALLWYRFDFGVPFVIAQADTWLGAVVEALPPLQAVQVTLDALDPHDPNLGTSGPDGRAEAGAEIQVPQDD